MSISVAKRESSAVLITSFVPWLAHQKSNSSDDLIAAIQDRGKLPADSVWLRHVPVCFDLAPSLVIGKLQQLRPRAVICCGMAESRDRLSVEQQAVKQRMVRQQVVEEQTVKQQAAAQLSRTKQAAVKQTAVKQTTDTERILQTAVNVQALLAETTHSEVSYDAGRYVCNHLYYQVLAAISASKLDTVAIFIHVPILNDQNRAAISSDFLKIYSAL